MSDIPAPILIKDAKNEGFTFEAHNGINEYETEQGNSYKFT